MDFYFDGIEELERDFRRAEVEFSSAARRAAEMGAKEGIAEAKATHRYTDRTGDLTGTSYSRLIGSAPGAAVAEMVWPKSYASFVDGGTDAHMIAGNPFLRFQWKGVWVTFRYVNHPGTRAYGFAGNAQLKAERVMYRELEVGVFRAQGILDS